MSPTLTHLNKLWAKTSNDRMVTEHASKTLRFAWHRKMAAARLPEHDAKLKAIEKQMVGTAAQSLAEVKSSPHRDPQRLHCKQHHEPLDRFGDRVGKPRAACHEPNP
jgi:hypothetical protein